MKANILAKMLKAAAHGVDKKPTTEACGAVYLAVEDSDEGGKLLTAVGCNGEKSVEVSCVVGSDSPRVNWLAFKPAPAIASLNKFKGVEVELSQGDDGKLLLSVEGKVKASFKTLDEKQYDAQPVLLPGEHQIAIGTHHNLKDSLNRVSYAISNDNYRSQLNQVLVEARKGSIKMVTTDGHRLMVLESGDDWDFDLGKKSTYTSPMYMPLGMVSILTKVLTKKRMPVRLSASPEVAMAEFEIDNVWHTVLGKTDNGEFPTYDEVIPERNDEATMIRADVESLLDGLKMLKVIGCQMAVISANGGVSLGGENEHIEASVSTEIIADYHTLTLLPDSPLGPYRLIVGLYDPLTGQRLPLIAADGAPFADAILVTELSK